MQAGSTLDTDECPSGLWPWHADGPPAEGDKRKTGATGMRIEDQFNTYFLDCVCMRGAHQADRVVTDASVAWVEQWATLGVVSL